MYITCDAVTAKFLILAATLTSVLAWKMLRPPHNTTCSLKGRFSWWKRGDFFRSRSSEVSRTPASAKVRHYLRYRFPRARRMEYRAAGSENARVSSGGEQRVTRGSILYRGRGPPLVARLFSSMHDRWLFAANAGFRRSRAGTHIEDVVGTSPCIPSSIVSWPPLPPPVAHTYKSRFPADNRAEGHRRRAHLGVCNNAENVWIFLRMRNG